MRKIDGLIESEIIRVNPKSRTPGIIDWKRIVISYHQMTDVK
jgi:hypothetical protein